MTLEHNFVGNFVRRRWSAACFKHVNSSTPAQTYSILFLLRAGYDSELCSQLGSCQTTLVGWKNWTVCFARDWWCLCPHRWSLNGTLINLGLDRRRRLSGGNLIISSLDRYQDIGMYQCMAFNTVGAILSRRASLQFACKLQSVF